jgi:Pentapeptide repeats (8 copies)
VRFHADPSLPVRAQVVDCGPKPVANPDQLKLIRQGVEVWNAWREKERSTRLDLTGANLSGVFIMNADLMWANLSKANLTGAKLEVANLFGASLTGASMVETNLEDATLTDCRIYGISAWNLKLNEGTKQHAAEAGRRYRPRPAWHMS